MSDAKSAKQLPPIRTSFRFVFAYWTTFVVIGSYFWLNVKSRWIFGSAYREDRIIDLHSKNAKRIERTILRLQGLFIKVGQLFSIMTNFLPEEFRADLENLQDAVPARPYKQIEKRIVEEFGALPLEVYKEFDETPIASASLGQVHGAVTKDGEKVAVKVQHVGVEAMSRRDLKTIRKILSIVKLFFKVRGLDNYYHEIRAMIADELNFVHEAEHIEQIARNFSDNDGVTFPEIYADLSTERVLTLGYLDGVKITERSKIIEMGFDPEQLCSDLVKSYCQMIFVDGVYHADPHPGNVLVNYQGQIVFLDFGAVGHLRKSMREGISSMFEGILKADERQLLDALRSMGFLKVGSNQEAAASRVIEHFHRRFQDEISLDSFSLGSIKIDTNKGLESLADLRQMDIGLRELAEAFHVPKEWVLLERTALLLTGLCTHLAPEMNPTDTIRPYLEEFVLGKDWDWSEMFFDITREKMISVLALPTLLEKVLNRAMSGNVSFKVEGISAAANLLYSAGHQLVYTALTIGSGGVALYFHHHEEFEFARYAGYGALGMGTLLFLSMIRARHFRRKL